MKQSNNETYSSAVNLEECRIETTPDGEQIAWVPDDEFEGNEYPVLLFRSPEAATHEYHQISDYVWYNRHQQRKQKIEHGEIILNTPNAVQIHKTAESNAKKIEKKYGLDYLYCNEVEHFIRLGRMSALAWMLGSSWEESLDT